MVILFLSKRRPQGRDLLTRPYGRFFHLPRLLAQAGHTVYLFLLSYRNDPPVSIQRNGIRWISESVRPLGPERYLRHIRQTVDNALPDCFVGFSDTYYGILAVHLAKQYAVRSVIDAYDNYESYIPWLMPLHKLWRKALKEASAVTAAGPQLAELLQRSRPNRPVHVVPMAADPYALAPMDRDLCRRRLGLPLEPPLVGYCGSIYRNRGIQLLFSAFEELQKENSNIRLILSGRKERGLSLPSYAKWLGYLPDEDIPYLLNAMNVLVVINQLSAFGRYSYPVKLYEALSCRIPVVATATDPAKWILGHCSRFLATPGDACDLARKIWDLLPAQRPDYGEVNDWEKSFRLFEKALLPAP
jgi:glycosyltransferase involved in cell wall biosynthesis